MNSNTPLPTMASFGHPGDPLVVAVDDAWFEGDYQNRLAPLDATLALRSRSGQPLSKLIELIRAVPERGADLDYLLLLAQICDRHRLHLLLCNFEHAEANFRQAYNRPEVAVIFDVAHANRQDDAFGIKQVVRLLGGESPKGEPFFVTGAPGQVLAEANRNIIDPRWKVLDRVNPTVAKGSTQLKPKLEQFAADFARRAPLRRYQFWGRLGSSQWTVVFDWENPVGVPIDVPSCYLAVLVARPGEEINPLWLDMINQAGANERKGSAAGVAPKDLRLMIVTEFLRTKVGNLTEAPTKEDWSELEEVDFTEFGHEDATAADADGFVAVDEEMQHPTAGRMRLDYGSHIRGPEKATPFFESQSLKDIVREYAWKARHELNPEVREQLQLAVADLRQHLSAGTLSISRDKRAKMNERVQTAYRRAREYFAESASILKGRTPGIAKLAQHFGAPKTLPAGVKGNITYVYRPEPLINWTTRPLD